jgi:4-amino-4-deoxy-L-arabinose transferase-like glycosyltransferase
MRRSAGKTLMWLLLLGAALGVRVAAAAWWEARLPPGVRFAFGDSESYWALAATIARGEPFRFGGGGPQVFRTPGYPLVLAPLFAIYGDEPPTMAARVLGAALGVAAVACVGGLAWTCFDNDRPALLAAGLAACYPGAIAMSILILSEAPFCPPMLLQLIAWVQAWKSETRRAAALWSLVAGAAAGAATLVRPSWLLFTPFAVAISLAVSRPLARQTLIGALMLLALAAAMCPWWIRNYLATGHFVATTLQAGASLYDGLSPYADGSSNMAPVADFDREFLKTFPPDRQPTRTEIEVELDRRLHDAAVAWAREHPGQVARLAAVKFLRMWNVLPNAQEFQSLWVRLAVAFSYTPLLVLALWGAWRFRRDGWPFVLCVLPAVYLTAMHMVFVGSIRYREPAMLALIVLAAGVLTNVGRIGNPPQTNVKGIGNPSGTE